ncbi:MAG: RagB/SusD family nutrient uptake outer membrane protein [Filimonas sp.]|nr:RagB/SusD family nutrient uptake outer membrane protein [Filimonas sp.]
MKKIFHVLTTLAITIHFLSCKKFLEETPKSSQPADAYYQTIEQVQTAVNYLYGTGTGPGNFYAIGGLYDGNRAFMLDNMSGLANNVVAQNAGIRAFAALGQTPENAGNVVGGIWSSFYSNIASANTVIAKIAGNKNLDPATVAPLLATAKFYRAIDYYYLVRLFGPVPLILKPYTSVADVYSSRTGIDSVYKAIVSDLTDAYTNGGLADKPMGSNGNQISKGTVGAVLSEVYLTMAGYPLAGGATYYQKAFDLAKEILASSGGYALFNNSGSTAFDKLRNTANDKGSEYPYFIEADASIRASALPQYSLPNVFPQAVPDSKLTVKYTLLTQAWTPTPTLLNLYDSVNDIRRHEKQLFSTSFDYTTTTGTAATIRFPYYMPYRWFDSTAIFSTAASSKYTTVYRLADVYLVAAEAANELGQDPTPYLQPILARAYVIVPPVATGQTARRNQVLAERFRELAMEGHFWFDMLRTRLYPDADALHQVTFSALVGHSNGRGQTYANKDLLLPLPPTEIQRNPSLGGQNPGY